MTTGRFAGEAVFRRGAAENLGAPLDSTQKGRRAAVWINQAHLAPEHIDELRQVFDSRVPKELSDLRLACPDRHRVLRIVHQRPEFQDLKTATTSVDARTFFEHGTGAFQLHQQEDDDHQR